MSGWVTEKAYLHNTMVTAERVRLLYVNSPLVLIGVMITAFVSCAMFWHSIPREQLLSWLAANVLLSAIRWLVGKRFYVHFDPDGSNATFWAVIYSLGALASGVLWGALPWLILSPFSTFNILSVSMILLGMISASVGSHSAYPLAYFSYAIPVTTLLATRIALEGGDFFYLVLLMFGLLIVNMGYSLTQCHMISTSIRQRFENMALMKDLAAKRSEAEKANQDKSRFLAAASHDLRQPLHALDLFLGTLGRELTTISQARILEQASQSRRALGELLNALLDVSRLDAGQMVPNLKIFHLLQTVNEVSSGYHYLRGHQRNIRIRVPDVVVNSDPVLLCRILRNLVSNAVKHTDGDVLIGARKRGNMLRIEVHDQGDGIPEKERETVFSEFYQLNNPERDRNKGLGLGLAIVRRLSALLDHPVVLINRHGKGTCFTVMVPLGNNVPESKEEMELSADLAGLFVLAIDDEAPIREGLRMLLRSRDCEVLTADSGDAALAMMHRDNYPPPDVILADYRLRGHETGLDAVCAIRKHFNREIRAIIVTGDTHADIIKHCRKAGCEYITKPVQHERLIAMLAAAEISG